VEAEQHLPKAQEDVRQKGERSKGSVVSEETTAGAAFEKKKTKNGDGGGVGGEGEWDSKVQRGCNGKESWEPRGLTD